MKLKTLLLLALILGCQTSFSQDQADQLTKVESIDATIATLYGVISGEKGQARDWELFTYLFKEEAKLIFSAKTKYGSYQVVYMSPDDYIKRSGAWLAENGFYEKEIGRQEDRFGTIAQVFSTYESFRSKKDTQPFMRGINSIQLQFDGSRWWIVNIYWTQETPENPIPAEYIQNRP
ncbi:hypothetical protein [Gilvibacter sp.]|uniref:hypothetical protein n=1 Tax=Gilvibacter sp. TaxID=2729997 RepID=UPI0025C5F623|nr:hypothetical protein [Gilvibacter sp.]NQX78568.1 hypothetical protein [Gilvibacter sp.]